MKKEMSRDEQHLISDLNLLTFLKFQNWILKNLKITHLIF